MLNKLAIILTIIMASFLMTQPAKATLRVIPLENPALEQRAKELGLILRCLICLNQSIESSDIELSIDMKNLVRTQMKDGKTNVEIKQFLVDRYGEFILLEPAFNKNTYLLWFTPIILLILASLSTYFYFKNMKKRVEGQE